MFQDGDFLSADWEQIVDPANLSGSVSLARVPNGGSPGAYQEIGITGYAITFQIYTARTYDPAVQGAIRELDYRELARALARTERQPELVLHFWSAEPAAADEVGEAALDRGCFSLLFLAQAAAAQGWTAPLEIARPARSAAGSE